MGVNKNRRRKQTVGQAQESVNQSANRVGDLSASPSHLNPEHSHIVQGEVQSYAHTRRDRVDFVLRIAGLVATLAYVLFAGLQWRATKVQAELADRAVTLSEKKDRPWLGLKMPTTDTDQVLIDRFGDSTIKWSLPLRNFGSTPALRVRWKFDVAVVPRYAFVASLVENRIKSYELKDRNDNSVFPDQEAVHQDGRTLTQEQMSRILAREDLVIVYGRVDYFDQAERKHMTPICVIYMPSSKAGERPGYQVCHISLQPD